MTIEEEFFKTFGIEIQEKSYCSKGYCIRKPSAIKFSDCKICRNCEKGHFYIVPEITDRILLELICILSQDGVVQFTKTEDIKTLKSDFLKTCIDYISLEVVKTDVRNQFVKKVHNLFGGKE